MRPSRPPRAATATRELPSHLLLDDALAPKISVLTLFAAFLPCRLDKGVQSLLNKSGHGGQSGSTVEKVRPPSPLLPLLLLSEPDC